MRLKGRFIKVTIQLQIVCFLFTHTDHISKSWHFSRWFPAYFQPTSALFQYRSLYLVWRSISVYANIEFRIFSRRCYRPLIWLSSSFNRWHIGSQDDGDVPLWLYVGSRLRSTIERGLPLSLTSWLTRRPRSPVAVGCRVQRRFSLFFDSFSVRYRVYKIVLILWILKRIVHVNIRGVMYKK